MVLHTTVSVCEYVLYVSTIFSRLQDMEKYRMTFLHKLLIVQRILYKTAITLSEHNINRHVLYCIIGCNHIKSIRKYAVIVEEKLYRSNSDKDEGGRLTAY